ncbi:MAG: AAA family ATPase [Actinomycetes bacterium]
MSDALVAPVQRFVAEVRALVDDLDPSHPGVLDRDLANEAATLVAGCIDADQVHTDEELRAYVVAFGPLLGGSLPYATPDDLRRGGTVRGRRSALERPSPLFHLLADTDAADGGARAWTYFRAAMDLLHHVASLDVHTSANELDAIGRFRALLLHALSERGVRRPDGGFFGLPVGAEDEAAHVVHGGPPATGGAAPPARTRDAAGAGVPVTAPPDLPPARPLEELLADLDGLIGLEPVKAEVRLVADLLVVQRLREQRGLKSVAGTRHLVFTGNPGTGKTTVARLLAQVFRTLEVVEHGHLVETDRSQLVAGYVGQTAERTRGVILSAVDGVLLIDEAYALARGGEDDFGREAIDTLVKHMEDLRDRLVVIVAGYPEEMGELIATNPGLRSRFPRTIHFPDYSDDELVAILEHVARGAHYELDDGAREAARTWFAAQPRDRGFGNGRLARNLFEAAVGRQAQRLVAVEDPSDEDLVTLRAGDLAGVELDS